MAFGSIVFTTRGKVLQSKAQAGTKLTFTKLAIGDGELGSQSVLELTDLKSKKLDIPISSIKVLTGGLASVGGTFTNKELTTGFYWRELGLFATDPDIGEILYCYGNAGALAEYIPASGGSQILEKRIDIETIVGNATNVNAVINNSLVYATIEDVENHNADPAAHPKITEQIKILEGQFNNLDVSSDVEGVVNRRLNPDTSKPLSTLVSGWVDVAKTAILNAIAILTTHVTSARDNTNNHITSQHTATKNTVNAARDNIKSHVESTISGSTQVYNLHASNVIATLSTNLTCTVAGGTQSLMIGKFVPLYDGCVYLLYKVSNVQAVGGLIYIYSPTLLNNSAPLTITEGALELSTVAVGSVINGRRDLYGGGITISRGNDMTSDVKIPMIIKKGIPIYITATCYNSADANKMIFSYVKILGSVV